MSRNRRRRLRPGRRVPAAAAALLALACGAADEAPSRWVVLGRGSEPAVDPGNRITGASRLFVVDAARPGAPPRPIAEGLAAAGSPAVAWDGRLLFTGRAAEGDPLGLWSVELPAGAPEPLPAGERECGSADLLPDGRIVFSARVAGPPPAPELASRWALFVLEPETGEVRRITYGLSEIDPTVLQDGRILYAQWQPPGDDRNGEGAFALFAVHPDGTGVTAVHGFHDGPAWKLRPWQLANGDLAFLAADESGGSRWRRVDRRSPSETAVDLALPAGLEATALGRGSGESILAVGAEGLYRLVDGTAELLVPGVEAEVVAAASPRPRPQGHLSMVDPELGSGQIFGVDARPPGRAGAAALRVRSLSGPAWRPEVLGTVDLAADGSFFVEVPANLPLLLDVLDAEGRPIEASATPLWVRPKEKRGCVGCHEDPHLAPPNRRPLAVLDPPVDLTGGGA